MVWANGLLLLLVAAHLTRFLLATDLHRDEAGFGFALALGLVTPLVLEFVALLLLALFRLRPR